MMHSMSGKGNKIIGNWLMLGVCMILVQVVLGGITRLTQSGLSITNWDVILGTLPPMNKQDWLEAFEAYRQIPQYEVLNKGMSLAEFKWIYFWEYIHRLWGRVLGFVFLLPLIFFAVKKYIRPGDLYKYIVVLLLGGMQGFVGWIMVKSGLEDRIFVDPVKLMLHLVLATTLLVLVYRLALENLSPPAVRLYDRRVRQLLGILVVLLMVQIAFGGLVAGSRAALAYPTWPKMGAVWMPDNIMALKPAWKNFLENTATLQFMHRMMAYVIIVYAMIVVMRCARLKGSDSFHRARYYLVGILFFQVILGIITVTMSRMHIPVFWGVAHQLTALILLLVAYYMHYAYKFR
jgi:cytochrome c oxidase assembly protein subunit 15